MSEARKLASGVPATIGVAVVSFQRPHDLARCLDGLALQTRKADLVVVVLREEDGASRQILQERLADPALPIRLVLVREPGVVAARNAGLQNCQTDVVAMLDDDAVPRPDWIERILQHFVANPHLGALGGRDQCFTNGVPQAATKDVVGRLLWNGKHIGNHALGRGAAREVDLLKGANMSFRRAATDTLSFDRRLRGRGAQPCEDFAFSRAISLAGWSVMYDPAVLVDHYEGAREEVRHYAGEKSTDMAGFSNSAYNQVVAAWDSLSPLRRFLSLVYFALVGTRVAPGLVQAFRFTPQLRGLAWKRFFVAQGARLSAYRDLLRS